MNMKIKLCKAQTLIKKVKIIYKINKYLQVFKKVTMRMISQSTKLTSKIIYSFKNKMLKEKII